MEKVLKKKTKYFFIVFSCALGFTLLPFSLKAQERIAYEYDHAGNRISRSYIVSRMNTPQKSPVEATTGNEDIYLEHQVTIYPNPTRHTLQVDIQGITSKNQLSFVLMNSEGVILQTIRNISEGLPVQIDMSSYTVGWYILDVTIDGKSQQFKIIKQ